MKQIITLFLFTSMLYACTEREQKNDSTKISVEERIPANAVEANIYASADSMMYAFKQRDWNTFARFTHPAMVRVMGGVENIALLAQQQMEGIPDSLVKSARINKILQVEKVGEEMQCLVEQTLVMEMEKKRITSITYLIGESLNEGKSWTFFDASNTGRIRPLDIKPNLSSQFTIPEKKLATKSL